MSFSTQQFGLYTSFTFIFICCPIKKYIQFIHVVVQVRVLYQSPDNDQSVYLPTNE